MKNLIVVLVLVMSMGFVSCEIREHQLNKVYQNVLVSQGDRYLKTIASYNGQVMSMEIDKISELTTDSILSITTKRYNDANELLEGLVKLNNQKQ